MSVAILLLFGLMGLGYLCKRVGLVSEELDRGLEKLVINVTLPAAILLSFSRVELGQTHLELMLIGTVVTFGLLFIYWGFFSRIFKDRKILGVAITTAFFSNAGFLGLPVMASLFGDEGLSLAIAFQSFSHGDIWMFSLAAGILAYYSTQDIKFGWKFIVKKVLSKPPIIAVFVGALLRVVGIPGVLDEFLSLIADANTFLILFLVGLMLKPKQFSRRLVKPLVLIGICNLVVTPVVTHFVARAVTDSAMAIQIATLESAMPMAVITLVLIKEYELDVELGELVLIVTTVLSVGSLLLVQLMF